MQKRKVAYKVVGKEFRKGTNLTVYIDSHYKTDTFLAAHDKLTCSKQPKDKRKLLTLFEKKYKNYMNFFPTYTVNNVIESVKGSIGILCFEHKIQAKRFIESEFNKPENFMIIKVLGYGPAIRKGELFAYCASIPSLLWDKQEREYQDSGVMDFFNGTIAYKKVLVLE